MSGCSYVQANERIAFTIGTILAIRVCARSFNTQTQSVCLIVDRGLESRETREDGQRRAFVHRAIHPMRVCRSRLSVAIRRVSRDV